MTTAQSLKFPMLWVGSSRVVKEMQNFTLRVANSLHTVLLTGPTGSGKDFLARMIHNYGPKNVPFVQVNCGALTDNLLESELFGHEKGAFTGAQETKVGLVEVAKGGTLFLNEIGTMSPAMQVRILQLLEGKPFRRVGGGKEINVDARIIVATNEDLEKAVEEGRMRSDLYYRLQGITFVLPSLQERAEDILVLAEHFLRQEDSSKTFSSEAMEVLKKFPWPGNIRELQNTVTRAVFSSNDQAVIHPNHLGLELSCRKISVPCEIPHESFEDFQTRATRRYLDSIIREVVSKGGCCADVAQVIGESERTMQRWIQRCGLSGLMVSCRKSS